MFRTHDEVGAGLFGMTFLTVCLSPSLYHKAGISSSMTKWFGLKEKLHIFLGKIYGFLMFPVDFPLNQSIEDNFEDNWGTSAPSVCVKTFKTLVTRFERRSGLGWWCRLSRKLGSLICDKPWNGLRENLQETIDFPLGYRVFR